MGPYLNKIQQSPVGNTAIIGPQIEGENTDGKGDRGPGKGRAGLRPSGLNQLGTQDLSPLLLARSRTITL